jgi:hypothetical protein
MLRLEVNGVGPVDITRLDVLRGNWDGSHGKGGGEDRDDGQQSFGGNHDEGLKI